MMMDVILNILVDEASAVLVLVIVLVVVVAVAVAVAADVVKNHYYSLSPLSWQVEKTTMMMNCHHFDLDLTEKKEVQEEMIAM